MTGDSGRAPDLPTRPKARLAGVAAVLAAALLWGTTGTIQTLLPVASDPMAVGALRLVFGALALVALALLRAHSRHAFRRLPWRAIIVAGVAIAAYNLLFFRAVLEAGVGVGTALAIGSAPVWVTAIEAASGRGRPGRLRLLGQALAIAGAALLVLAGSGGGGAGMGALLALLAGGAYAAYSLATERAGTAVPTATLASATFCVAALVAAPALVIAPPVWLSGAAAWTGILFLGIGATGLSYALYTWGLGRVTASTAVTLALAEPVTAWLLGIFVVGEAVTVPRLAGAGLILAGLVIVTATGAPGRDRVRAAPQGAA